MYCEPALQPRYAWEDPQSKSQGFKLDSGDPTVQDYRGASGNVAMVELGTRLAIERARTVTLHLKLARWSSIPTCGSRRTLSHSTRTRLSAGLRVSHGWASVRTSDELGRYSSERRTGCAKERPSGSVRGAAGDGCPYRDHQSPAPISEMTAPMGPDSEVLRRYRSRFAMSRSHSLHSLTFTSQS